MVFRVCASKSQADWPGNNGYPGKLDAWFRERPARTTENQTHKRYIILSSNLAYLARLLAKYVSFGRPVKVAFDSTMRK